MIALNLIRLNTVFNCLIVAWLLSAPDIAWAESNKFYTATELRGSVLTRGQNSAYWREVKEGVRLRAGQIIQVTLGGAVTLAEWDGVEESSGHGAKVKLRIRNPMIARLTADLLREVKVSEYFIEKSYSQGTPVSANSSAGFSFSDAWNRISSVVSGRRPSTHQNSLADLEKQGMALSMTAKKIKLLAPGMNAVFQTESWPLEITLVWVAVPVKGAKYAIYLWPAGEARGQPVAESGDSFYTVHLQKPGTFMVQVSTLDNSWQSPAHAVHTLVPANELVKNGVGKTSVSHRSALASAYPPDRFVVTSADSRKPLVFSWHLNENFRDHRVGLSVRKESGELIKSLSTSLSQAELALPEGRYVWSLDSEGKERLMHTRSLVVVPHAAGEKASKNLRLLMQLISSGETSTLALDGGL